MEPIRRDIYLNRLIARRHNQRIKIVTGVRRSGKSYLLFTLFDDWLRSQGVDHTHIIKIDLEDRRNRSLRDPDALLEFIDSRMIDDDMYYILIDEIQLVREFEDVLYSYLKIRNADLYVTGSNARFLSKDIVTTFRGRGDVVHIYPLCFSEYHSAFRRPKEEIVSDVVENYEKTHYPIAKPTVGELIRLSIEEKGITQKELARELGVSPSRVSDYINGRAEPSLRIARALCLILDIAPAAILGI